MSRRLDELAGRVEAAVGNRLRLDQPTTGGSWYGWYKHTAGYAIKVRVADHERVSLHHDEPDLSIVIGDGRWTRKRIRQALAEVLRREHAEVVSIPSSPAPVPR